MSDLISCEAVKRCICEYWCAGCELESKCSDVGCDIRGLLLAVDDVPTSAEDTVAHAHWLQPNEHRPMYECSNCGWYVDVGGYKDFTYCPNCGAKMRHEYGEVGIV